MLPVLEKEAEKTQEATQAKPGEQVGSKVGTNWHPPSSSGKSLDKAADIVGVGSSTVSDRFLPLLI